MNKLKCLVAVIALFVGLSLNGQLLWKVTGNSLSKPSYLFGTHHLVDKNQLKDADKIIALSKQTDAVVGEMDIPDPTTAQMQMMQAGMMVGTTLKEFVSAEDYQLADNEFQQLMGVGMAQLGMMKPMLLETLYQALLFARAYGMTQQPEAMDMVLQKVAKENNRKVVGLETLDQQMKILFNSIPVKRQAEILIHDIKDKQHLTKELLDLTDAYKAGNLAKMEEMDKADTSMTPEERKPLIDNRNEAWLKQLPTLMKEQSCFVAVGAMHLMGDAGLVKQLQKAGYTVEAVTL